MGRILSIAVCSVLFCIQPAFSDASPTAQGRWSVGGSLSFPFEYTNLQLPIFGFFLNPEGSYFVLEGWEISGGVLLANVKRFDHLEDRRLQIPSNVYWGIEIGSHYFFQTGAAVQPYIGAEFGITLIKLNVNQMKWYLQFPVGVAWFLHPNIAINLGMEIAFDFASTSLFEKFRLNPGYLGIKAYF